MPKVARKSRKRKQTKKSRKQTRRKTRKSRKRNVSRKKKTRKVVRKVTRKRKVSRKKKATTRRRKRLQMGGSSLPTLHYYAMERCGHCVRFNPTWDELVAEHPANVILEKTIYEESPDIIREKRITGFPTIRAEYPDGKIVAFGGRRQKDELLNFINNL